MDEQQYSELLKYLRTGEFPQGLQKNKVDILRRKKKKYITKNGLLFFRDEKSQTDLQAKELNYCPDMLLVYYGQCC